MPSGDIEVDQRVSIIACCVGSNGEGIREVIIRASDRQRVRVSHDAVIEQEAEVFGFLEVNSDYAWNGNLASPGQKRWCHGDVFTNSRCAAVWNWINNGKNTCIAVGNIVVACTRIDIQDDVPRLCGAGKRINRHIVIKIESVDVQVGHASKLNNLRDSNECTRMG